LGGGRDRRVRREPRRRPTFGAACAGCHRLNNDRNWSREAEVATVWDERGLRARAPLAHPA
jgi:hypothetical protein